MSKLLGAVSNNDFGNWVTLGVRVASNESRERRKVPRESMRRCVLVARPNS